MMRLSNATIKQRLLVTTIIASTSALLVAGTGFVAYHWLTFRSHMVRTQEVRADILAVSTARALSHDDQAAVTEALRPLHSDPEMLTARVFRADGTVLGSYDAADAPASARVESVDPHLPDASIVGDGVLRVSRAIREGDERQGTVVLVYSMDRLSADLFRSTGLGAISLAISVALATIFGSMVYRNISDRIEALADVARRVSRDQDYSLRARTTGTRDELGTLTDTVNEMLAQIQIRDRQLDAERDRYRVLTEELESRVRQRTEELQATNDELEAFTYSVSHDLRAPLRRIDGFANLLVEQHAGELSPQARHYLTRVRSGTTHMGELVDDLLNLARLGRKELAVQTTGLSSIVSGVVKTLAREASDRRIDWRIDRLPFVDGDPALLEVVYMNLLSNAVKYTRPRATAIIEVGTRDEGGQQVLFVRDNGVGFNMKYADKLFGVFQRLHRAEDFEGTGVGLATVQRIIHKHGGRIWVEAQLDKGACFFFTLGAPGQAHEAIA